MKRLLTTVMAAIVAITINAATEDVTNKYLVNPDFAARFAGWDNEGSFTFNVASTFEYRNGEVWMEKWVARGSQLGSNTGIYQRLRNLADGTYTLVAGAQNIDQNNTTKNCTGAYLYAGVEQVSINQPNRYSVVFTVANGKADVGIKLSGCNGNWVCIDNFKLYYNGINEDSLATEKARLEAEAKDLEAKYANPTGKIPTVVTHPYVAMGATIALGRATFNANGASFKERGFCWSKNPNPTINDERSTLYFSNNGNIYHMDNLEPGTFYYVRAYAITTGYQVAYGDVVKIATLPMGRVAYSYDFAGDAETNARINSASAETVWMYNQLSNIRGFYLQVHYVPGSGAGGGTADCSYGGWMRVSQNVPYQQTGTILHETNHGVGVGTTKEWYNNSILRAETTRGLWLGKRATDMVRFFDNSTTSTMTGDGTHMWPYGINGANEDSYNPSKKVLYYANIMITHALHQDGLVCSKDVGFATPSYVFNQVDNKKYYIQIEDPAKGMGTKYLTLSSTNTLTTVKSTAEDAKKDDNLAWYISYDPKTSLYSFYNVGKKRYISGTFTTSTTNTSGKYMLMPSRVEAVYQGSPGYAFKGQSYWILKAENNYSPAALGINTTNPGNCTFDFKNTAKSQRWLFLDDEEITRLEEVASHSDKTDLLDMIAKVKVLKDVPHDEITEGITTKFEADVEEFESRVDDFNTEDEIQAAKEELRNIAVNFMEQTTTSDPYCYDITFMITNPTLSTSTEGWVGGGTSNYGCVEFFEKEYEFKQTLSDMPLGSYKIKVQGFERPGTSAETYDNFFKTERARNYASQSDFFISTKKTKLNNIWCDFSDTSLGTGSINVNGKYIPNNMQSASAWFKNNLYDNEIVYSYTRGKVHIKMDLGITLGNTTSLTARWICFNNFRLYYYGKTSSITGINDIADDVIQNEAPIYDMTGRQTKSLQKGIYISNGRKLMK